jgi:hypothetical protein
MYFQAGYREGITAGQQATAQAGFDEGYNTKGVPLGRETGLLRGVAASVLAYLGTNASIDRLIAPQDHEAFTQQARDLVRKLGKFRVADLAGPDVEAEQHAKEHGEDVVVPQQIQDQRDMDSLQDSLEGLTNQRKIQTSAVPTPPYEELQACKRELKGLLERLNLNISLD